MRTAQSTLKNRIHVSDDPAFLTIGQVKERYGCSAMWVHRKMAAAELPFPQPVRFGGATSARRWRLADLLAWEAQWEA